ncbi:sigma-70 family RNA polymerase sigma factor [Niabella yanshanensis]|uniref:Sigma-70 family RNA polymerase sigma factor n=1 Tax=Niabella yanshanensis TaxID=577386 RepID=A0ABZ0WA84_9BACT|nr:sigma-70 family RNA polymerase sigma factor [Niabella yanshanensis]WQD39419.1 sigma-70 family RNA polymerase sigma factor [Niabella yanshanensis]
MQQELIPHLFRTEYRKMVAVLCSLFGLQHIETAEDIVSDTFLSATELWGLKGVPENPVAWLYTVAKNKTKNYLKRGAIFDQKVSRELQSNQGLSIELEPDLSEKNINDSQLAMMFAICHPAVNIEAQVALSLNLLCGFGVQEIADAFLTNKEVVYKRIQRAKEKLRQENAPVAYPTITEIGSRMDAVLSTLYLLFNEGYYSFSQNNVLRKELCWEAMRLCHLLVVNEVANTPSANALLSLMCFHASRFEARLNEQGELILYKDQDTALWDQALIERGRFYLKIAFTGDEISKYHLEAAIASWHTIKEEAPQKWQTILQLYDQLLMIDYSPMAALNRVYVFSKVHGKEQAIIEAGELTVAQNHLYFTLQGKLYEGIDNTMALQHFNKALTLTNAGAEKQVIQAHIRNLQSL